MSRPGQKRLLLASAAATAAVLAVVGCSSSTSSSGPSASGSANPNSALNAAGSGGAGSKSVTNYLLYTDGKSGKADPSLAPVDIGWLNQQGGASAIGPLATNGAESAVNYINTDLGGVDGHPLKLVTCFITSAEEEGTTCGQQFAADKNIDVIGEGGVAIGIQPFYSAIGKKTPVIVGVAATTTDSVQPNAVILFGDVTHVLGPFGTYAKDYLKAKTAALVYPDIPGITEGAAAIEAGLKAAGVSVKAVGYDPSQADLTSVLTAAGALTADMVVPYADAADCVNLAKSMTQLGITDSRKIVSAPLCLSGQVAAGLGGDYPLWTYAIASSLYGDPTDPGMPIYEKVTKQFSTPADAPDPWNIVAFSQILTIDRFMNELGYGHITASAILAEAKAFTGPVALGAPALKCGEFPSAPAVCNDRTQFFLYQGHNKWVKTAGWLLPPS